MSSQRPSPAPVSAAAVARANQSGGASHAPAGGITLNFNASFQVGATGGDSGSLITQLEADLQVFLERWTRDREAEQLRLQY